MKIKKTWFVRFFKCLFVLRVCAVKFESDKFSMSNFVKFQFLSMTLKIERVFQKTKQKSSLKKTGQKGHEFSNQKGP